MLGCTDLLKFEIAMAVSSMSSLSRESSYQLNFFLDNCIGAGSEDIHLDIPPTTSRLSIEADGKFHRKHCQ